MIGTGSDADPIKFKLSQADRIRIPLFRPKFRKIKKRKIGQSSNFWIKIVKLARKNYSLENIVNTAARISVRNFKNMGFGSRVRNLKNTESGSQSKISRISGPGSGPKFQGYRVRVPVQAFKNTGPSKKF
uniref:Uncharacterized protein n=1 Tax=Romanomermis culicivorax TaxID=13658 RepID=A0A915J281_ROMCU